MSKRDDAAQQQDAIPLGRRRDASRDADILGATLDVLADVGPARLTVDMVAARAGAGKATIYRRWASKTDLILGAIEDMKRRQVDLAHLPDTGNLRSDLLALFKPGSAADGLRRLKIMNALASLLFAEPTLSDAANAAVVQPWADAHLALMRRAMERGEVASTADIDTVSTIVPALAAFRALVQRKPFEREFLVTMLDSVILPALACAPVPVPAAAQAFSPRVTVGKAKAPKERS